jgi:hypothetical protein
MDLSARITKLGALSPSSLLRVRHCLVCAGARICLEMLSLYVHVSIVDSYMYVYTNTLVCVYTCFEQCQIISVSVCLSHPDKLINIIFVLYIYIYIYIYIRTQHIYVCIHTHTYIWIYVYCITIMIVIITINDDGDDSYIELL